MRGGRRLQAPPVTGPPRGLPVLTSVCVCVGGGAEHDDRVGGRGFPGRRKKGRGPFRGKMYSEVNHRSRNRGGSGLRARLDEDDGDVPMSEAHDGPRNR